MSTPTLPELQATYAQKLAAYGNLQRNLRCHLPAAITEAEFDLTEIEYRIKNKVEAEQKLAAALEKAKATEAAKVPAVK